MATQLLKYAEVAARLMLSRSTTYQLIQAGELRVIRVGRATRVPESEIDRFVSARLAAGEDTQLGDRP